MSSVKVLVVDDDADFAESLALAIESRGHQVDIVHSGEMAIKKLREEEFDICLMDVQMPGRNGVSSLLELQKTHPHARVVLMTGYSVPGLLQDAAENAVWRIMRKPLDMDEVLNVVDQCTRNCILIADDNPDFISQLQDALGGVDLHVLHAENGKQAVRHASTHPINLLIVDLAMPVMDGIDTCLELQEAGHALPTIVVSAHADQLEKAKKTLTQYSVNAVFRKPLDTSALVALAGELAGPPSG